VSDDARTEGWAWLSIGRRWHYYRSEKSLCDRQVYRGSMGQYQTSRRMFAAGGTACRGCVAARLIELEEAHA